MSYYTSHMEQLKLEEMKKKHPDWIWNRSDTHIFIKEPEAYDTFCTVVEPGNSFSPGPGTYGISTWLYTEGRLFAPEEIPYREMTMCLDEKKYPVSDCRWKAGDFQIESYLFQREDYKLDYRDYFRVKISNQGKENKKAYFYLVIRSFGAAGGPIYKLEECEGVVSINGVPLFYAENPGDFAAISYEETGKDIGCYLRENSFPESKKVFDKSTWASGAIRYEVELLPGQTQVFDFLCQLHKECEMFTWLKTPEVPFGFDEKLADVKRKRDELTTIEFSLPDPRLNELYQSNITHMYMHTAMNVPHLSPITYTSVWMRDSAAICTALDQAGLHEFCGRASNYMAKNRLTGGYGHEADLFGSRIQTVANHYLYTRDEEYLKENYKYVKEDAEDILRMCNTDEPLVFPNELYTHLTVLEPSTVFTCAPCIRDDERYDGLSVGRMDYYENIFYVNSYHYIGLRRAAVCARSLGFHEDDEKYTAAAEKIRKSLLKLAPGNFGHHWKHRDASSCHIYNKKVPYVKNNSTTTLHDTAVPFFPGEWGDKENAEFMKEFDNYWDTVYCANGIPHHEKLWPYFEASDALNRMLVGQKERAWSVLDFYISEENQFTPGMYTFTEDVYDLNSFYLAWEQMRGWDKAPCVTPHNWTPSIFMSFIRFAMVYEVPEKPVIQLGLGVPDKWMSQSFAVKDVPTFYGKISYSYDSDTSTVLVDFHKKAECSIEAAFPKKVEIKMV